MPDTTAVEESTVSGLKVKMDQAIRMVIKCIKAGLVPMIHGSPAIGKSAIGQYIADEFNLFMIDLRLSQCDPTDLAGFPQINAVLQRAGYVPMDTFPIAGDSLPVKTPAEYDKAGNLVKPATYYAGWLLFLDEFNSATTAVQAASYKIVLDRMVGKFKLHANCAIIAAGNLETDGAIVEPMSTAMQSRLVHMELEVCEKLWKIWAIKKGIDHRIIDYLGYKPSCIYTFTPDHSDRTYASPRTWEFANRIISNDPVTDPDTLPMLTGCITEGVAREFLLFCDIYKELPKLSDIMAAPKMVSVPNEPSILFATTGMIAAGITPANGKPLMEYLLRLPIEHQVVCMRVLMVRKPQMLNDASVQDWIDKNSDHLY